MTELQATLSRALLDPRAGWSMGSFGAIAEFHQDPGEPAEAAAPLTRATARGAVRLDDLSAVTPVAYETLSPRRHRWAQGVALCLPAARAARTRREVLTELGPDLGAIRPRDRQGVLFDMGLAQAQTDFCIRVDDPELLAGLRAQAGRSIFEGGNPAMGLVLRGHPHRVALTAIGRIEVFQKIGGPDTGGVSPPGPHTHLLPKLLRAARTHSANIPIPEGLVPCGYLHPASPVAGPMGEDKPFDPDLFDAFQTLLGRWGPADGARVKARVWAALDAGEGPESFRPPASRFGRAALRNALRQRARRLGEAAEAEAGLQAWIAAFDPPQSGEDAAADDDASGGQGEAPAHA